MITDKEILQNYFIRDMEEFDGTFGFMWVCDTHNNRVCDKVFDSYDEAFNGAYEDHYKVMRNYSLSY